MSFVPSIVTDDGPHLHLSSLMNQPITPALLSEMFTAKEMDDAVDRAARSLSAVTALYVAAPTGDWMGRLSRIELAIEFFVPPDSVASLSDELDRALSAQSPAYRAARLEHALGEPLVHVVPSGSFHQWRMTWHAQEDSPLTCRWPVSRGLLVGVLDHIRVGWRELL